MKRLLVVLTMVLVIAAGGSGWWWVRSSLPILDGQVALQGLRAPVEVLIDAHGVPSVYARDLEDAWFAAGVLHARDRRWQMELYRRVTMGRLSEVLGDTTIPVRSAIPDAGTSRRGEGGVGARRAAGAPGARAIRGRRERRVGGAGWPEAPDRISGPRHHAAGVGADRFAGGRAAAGVAAGGESSGRAGARRAGREVRRGDGALPDRRAIPQAASCDSQRRRIHPTRSPTIDPVAPTARTASLRLSDGQDRRGDCALPAGLEWLAAGARRGNSNNWVLAGGRTKSGRPILANDPHLQIEFPSVWYEMHLVAAGLDVIGVTIPGVPFVALGHNARIAWGMTATGADVQDLVDRAHRRRQEAIDVSRRVGADRNRHRRHSRAGPQRPLPFEVWKTRNGPIFADVDLDWDAPPSWLSPDGRPVRRAARLFVALGCGRRSRHRLRSDQPRQRLDVVHRPRSDRLPRRR